MSAARSNSLTLRLLRNPVAVISLVVLAVLIGAAVLAPVLAPYDPIAQDIASARQGPSADHLLGTDSLGRDILSRLMWGGRESLFGVGEALGVMLIIAVPFGVLTAYLGGLFDRLVLGVIDIMMAIPGIIITLATLAIFDSSMTAAMISVGALASGAFTRVFRSSVLAVRGELFVSAARVSGVRALPIMARHVLPHAKGVILVQASLFAAATLGIQTGLSFLAFGPPPPAPTWGGMVAEASTLLQTHPWMFVPTGGVIALATLALGLLGDSIRDAAAERVGSKRASDAGEQNVAGPLDALPVEEQTLLSVRGLTIVYGTGDSATTVVDGASFDVHRGEFVGLVGESGSGKTVTALGILGLLGAGGRITAGSVRFEGQEICDAPAAVEAVRGSGIAFISQEPMVALDPSFRIGWQLIEAIRHHDGTSKREARERALELLAAVRLKDPQRVFDSYPHQVSGGMAQRVVIARALAGRPRLLIADEPTTALDVTVQAEILDLLRSMQSDGMSVIIVTHDWGVVAETCQRAIVMYAGQIVETAPLPQMIDAPRHPYTRALLDSNPSGVTRGAILPTIGGTVPSPADWPVGCRFAARCPLATDDCRRAPIPVVELGSERRSRCIRIPELVEVSA